MSEADEKPSVEAGEGQPEKVEMRTVEVEFFLPDDLSIQYADNVNVFFSDYDFTITFLQTQAPLIIREDDWANVKTVKAKGVVRVVVPPHLIPRIANVLTENWQKFLQVREQKLQEQMNVNATTATSDNPAAEGDKS